MTNKVVSSFLTDKGFASYETEKSPYRITPMTHFALTDALIKHAGATNQPILHFWSTKPLIILGMLDTKLPYFNEALSVFKNYDYDYVVRNSGGLGVVSDPGVLNFSLIFPEEADRLTIDEGYDRMHHVIQTALFPLERKVDAVEIPNSYCPGDYDLSIDGKKFAGISQRRIKGGVAIMVYLSVNGDQDKRVQLMREFYRQGLRGEETKWHFPDVKEEVMTTLEQAYDQSISIDEVKRMMKEFHSAEFPIIEGSYTDLVTHHYKIGMEKMEKRNQKIIKYAN